MKHLILSGLLCLFLLQGCGFTFASGPPTGHAKLSYFNCNSSMAGPAADISWAVVDSLMAAAVSSVNTDAPNHSGNETFLVFAVTGAVTHVASALYGSVQAHRCGNAQEQLRTRIFEQQVAYKQLLDELEAGKVGPAVRVMPPRPASIQHPPAAVVALPLQPSIAAPEPVEAPSSAPRPAGPAPVTSSGSTPKPANEPVR